MDEIFVPNCVGSFLNLIPPIRKISGAVDKGQERDLSFPDRVNQSVLSHENLTNRQVVQFGHTPATVAQCSQRVRCLEYPFEKAWAAIGDSWAM